VGASPEENLDGLAPIAATYILKLVPNEQRNAIDLANNIDDITKALTRENE
jgi:hypothetical protein